MARGSIMLQLEVEQIFSHTVTRIPVLSREVFDFLDGDRATVRELAVEKVQALGILNLGSNFFESSAGNAFAKLQLAGGRRNPETLYAPSHVNSPQFVGNLLAILWVRDWGATADRSAINLVRAIAAHAYIDEVE
jgi:hypothetical protein